MLRRRVIYAYLGILAVWIQFLTPVAALSMERASDPFGVICGQNVAGHSRDKAPAHQHHGDCCVLCHANLGMALPGDRPVFTAFDYPVSSPLRWTAVRSLTVLCVPRHDSLPRGPPTLV